MIEINISFVNSLTALVVPAMGVNLIDLWLANEGVILL